MPYLPYLVGPDRAYRSVQHALDALASETDPFAVQREIVISQSGVYETFKIHAGMFSPTSTARLVIRAAPGVVPIFSGLASRNPAKVGAWLDGQAPYVTLKGLHFANLRHGVLALGGSHGLEIDRCMIHTCSESGVWIDESNQSTITNSIIADCLSGVVMTRSKNLAIVHSTLVNRGVFEDPSCLLHAQLPQDRGNGDEDTGRIYLYANVFASLNSHGLALYRRDLGKISSNHNLWWFPSVARNSEGTPTSSLATIRELLPNDQIHSEYVTRLAPELASDPSSAAWTTRTGQDFDSRVDDPTFRAVSTAFAHAEDSGYLRPANYVLQAYGAPVLHGDPDDLLPSFVRDSLLSTDFDGEARGSAPTIGAKQVVGSATIEMDPFVDLATGSQTGCDQSPLAQNLDLAKSALPNWGPKVRTGAFFSRDVQYHLYSSKTALTLGEASRTTFSLSALLTPSTIRVLLAGVDITDSAQWTVEGYTLTLHHGSLDVREDSDVIIRGEVKYWDATANAFLKKATEHRWKVREGMRSYVLPSTPKFGSPIVVTDDLLHPLDSLDLAQEFRTEVDEDGNVRLVFGGPNNLWQNPDFAYVDEAIILTGEGSPLTGYLPEDHELGSQSLFGVVGPSLSEGDRPEIIPLRAGRALLFMTGDMDDGWVGQRIPIDPNQPYVATFHASSASKTLDADLRVSVSYFDRNQDQIGSEEEFPFTVPAAGSTTTWKKFGISFTRQADETPGRPAFSTRVYGAGASTPPETAAHVLVKIHGASRAPLLVDAVQFEQGHIPGPFTRLPRGDDLTIEYEGGDGLLYSLEDLNLHPVRGAMNSGFFGILPVPARQWDPDAPDFATTLSDYRWSYGRLHVLPWAKISGFNKYRHAFWFSTNDRRMRNDTVAQAGEVIYPSKITVTPSILQVQQGSHGTFGIEVKDSLDNPYGFERARVTIFEPTGEFPGDLVRHEWGVPVEVGSQVFSDLNDGGALSLRWYAPSSDLIEYRGEKPEVTEMTGENAGIASGFIRTNYRVARQNHGNALLLDEHGEALETTGAAVTLTSIGSYSDAENVTRVYLPRMPEPGTVEIYTSETGEFDLRLQEVHAAPPLLDRHFDVDYENGVVAIQGVWANPFRISFAPKLLWTSSEFPRRVYIAKEILDEVTGEVILRYDAEMDLYVEAMPPRGHEQVSPLWFRMQAIAQHPSRTARWH